VVAVIGRRPRNPSTAPFSHATPLSSAARCPQQPPRCPQQPPRHEGKSC